MPIIESKPDNRVADLRLSRPWPELQQFADSIDLSSCEDVTHKHVPYGAGASHIHLQTTQSCICQSIA